MFMLWLIAVLFDKLTKLYTLLKKAELKRVFKVLSFIFLVCIVYVWA